MFSENTDVMMFVQGYSVAGLERGIRTEADPARLKETVADASERRRMGRAVRFSVICASDALHAAGTGFRPDAVLTSTRFGCVDYSERFLKSIYGNGETMLNPVPFIYSTFNTVSAAVARNLGVSGADSVFSGRDCALADMLLDASMSLSLGETAGLLAGYYEESTDFTEKAMAVLAGRRAESRSGELSENCPEDAPENGSVRKVCCPVDGAVFLALSGTASGKEGEMYIGTRLLFREQQDSRRMPSSDPSGSGEVLGASDFVYAFVQALDDVRSGRKERCRLLSRNSSGCMVEMEIGRL